MATSDAATPDADVFRHSGTGPQNVNTGDGDQWNWTIIGGSGNTQVIYPPPRGPSSEELDLEFRKKLFITDPTIDRASLVGNKGQAVGGTCEWILATKEYKDWLREDTPPLLWIWGGPGKGKTMLSLFISHALEKKSKTIYFFCSAGDEKCSTAVAVLRGLLWHLTGLYPDLARQLRGKFADCSAEALSSRRTLWTRLYELIKALGPERLYCIVDGLDECDKDSHQWLMDQFVSMNSSDDAGNFKIAVVSRGSARLPDVNQVRLDHEYSEEVRSSVRIFVESKAKDLVRQFKFDKASSKDLESKLTVGAQGIFLWAGFAVTDLRKQTEKREVFKALEELPSGLNPLYDRMLDGIESEKQNLTLCLLGYVALACRPLSLGELTSLIFQQLGLCITGIDIQALVEKSKPLMHMTGQTVTLVHESVRDYVKKSVLHDGLRLVPEETHLHFARACIEALERENSLAQYATQYWPEHARRAETLAIYLISGHEWFFRTRCSLRSKWWRKYKTYQRRTSALPNGDLRQLHMASYLGIYSWVDGILKRWPPGQSWFGVWDPCNSKDSQGCTPLHYAASQGFDKIVLLLMHYGADAGISDNYRQTVSTLAAESGHENVMRALLDNRVDPNECVLGETLLHCAAKEGHVGMVRLLLDRDADIDSETTSNGTALHVAINFQLVDVIEFLLRSGADPNITDSRDRTALHQELECSDGDTQPVRIVKLLLEKGANVEAKNRDGHTALHACALQTSNVESGSVATLLLRAHAEVKFSGGETALHVAVLESNFAVVQALLQHEADVHSKDGLGDNALHMSSQNGHHDTVELSVNIGASVELINARNEYGSTPLMLATDSSIAKLLLDHKADFNASENGGRAALQSAYCLENEATVKLLLERGADVNVRNSEDATPLHKAVSGDSEAVVKVLLTHNGVDVNARNKKGETALHLAARREPAMVQLLLEHKADVHARTERGDTPLHYLTCYSRDSSLAAKSLLDYGADKNARNQKRKTALSIAWHEYKYERSETCGNLVATLLANDACFDIYSEYGEEISRTIQAAADHGVSMAEWCSRGHISLQQPGTASRTPISAVQTGFASLFRTAFYPGRRS
jgi:ankyrin repeat protein